MTKVAISPQKFATGAGELSQLGDYIGTYGGKALLMAHKDDEARVSAGLSASADRYLPSGFRGEVSRAKIARLGKMARRRPRRGDRPRRQGAR